MRLASQDGRLHPGLAMHEQGCLGKRLGPDVDSTQGIVDAWLSPAKAVTCARLLQSTKLRVLPPLSFPSGHASEQANTKRTRFLFVEPRPSSLLKGHLSFVGLLFLRKPSIEGVIWKDFAAPIWYFCDPASTTTPRSLLSFRFFFRRSFLPTTIHSFDDLESAISQIRPRKHVQAIFRNQGRSRGQVEVDQDYISRTCEEEDAGQFGQSAGGEVTRPHIFLGIETRKLTLSSAPSLAP
jgi:hypothetical protein